MKRHWVLALATLVAIPRLAHAQGDPVWGPTLRITPFVGVSPGIKQSGTAYVFTTNSNNASAHPYDLDYSSSMPLGLQIEARLWNRFGINVGGAWSPRGEIRITDFEQEEFRAFDGADLFLAKANVAMHLREVDPEMQLRRLNASIFIGPAFIHDDPKNTPFTPLSGTESVNQWGLNFGAQAEMPLANKNLAFQVGLEDYLIYWDTDNYTPRVEAYVADYIPGASVVVDANKTHLWILRVGLSYRP